MNVLVNVEDFEDYEKKVFVTLLAENIKYKALWFLRELENEIDKEKGIIKIDVKHEIMPAFHIKGFSIELSDKIKLILSRVNFYSDLLS